MNVVDELKPIQLRQHDIANDKIEACIIAEDFESFDSITGRFYFKPLVTQKCADVVQRAGVVLNDKNSGGHLSGVEAKAMPPLTPHKNLYFTP
jgi:hypothetical protein